jgi:two-component system sensor histidine kinase EvgS
VEGAVQTFVHTASAKGLLLSSTADDRLAPAHVGDPLRIRQVLSNFLSNAVKFTETGGIEVRARVTEDAAAVQTVEFAVTDTGIGIAPEQQRLLFDDFAQAEATTTRRFGGSGLGLVICRRLAVLMGGDVTMESAPGAGTTLRLVLPLPVGDPAELDPSAVPAPGRPASTRPRPSRVEAEREGSLVLVADDHPVNRTVLGHQLELVGFHADVAEDGRQAFDLYRTGHYGIVLTDVNMPRLDGYELARAIRRHEQESGARRTPVIALTASVMRGEPEKCRAAGMDDFAAKPTTIPVLAGKLRRWLPDLDWPEEVDAESADGSGPEPEGELIDRSVLDEVTGGDAGIAASLMGDFVNTTQGDLDGLRAALAARNLDDVRRQAHRLKGAARTVGVRRIAAPAQEIEERAEAGEQEWVRFAALAEQIEQALDRVAHTMAT